VAEHGEELGGQSALTDARLAVQGDEVRTAVGGHAVED
jgi:hypothetical protein